MDFRNLTKAELDLLLRFLEYVSDEQHTSEADPDTVLLEIGTEIELAKESPGRDR